MNMGAFTYVAPRMKTCINEVDPSRTVPHMIAYSGRDPSASPATGYASVHKQEQAGLVEKAMTLK